MSRVLCTFFFLRNSKSLKLLVAQGIHQIVHNAQCTPRGGRSTPLGCTPQTPKKRPLFYRDLFTLYSNFLFRVNLTQSINSLSCGSGSTTPPSSLIRLLFPLKSFLGINNNLPFHIHSLLSSLLLVLLIFMNIILYKI